MSRGEITTSTRSPLGTISAHGSQASLTASNQKVLLLRHYVIPQRAVRNSARRSLTPSLTRHAAGGAWRKGPTISIPGRCLETSTCLPMRRDWSSLTTSTWRNQENEHQVQNTHNTSYCRPSGGCPRTNRSRTRTRRRTKSTRWRRSGEPPPKHRSLPVRNIRHAFVGFAFSTYTMLHSWLNKHAVARFTFLSARRMSQLIYASRDLWRQADEKIWFSLTSALAPHRQQQSRMQSCTPDRIAFPLFAATGRALVCLDLK